MPRRGFLAFFGALFHVADLPRLAKIEGQHQAREVPFAARAAANRILKQQQSRKIRQPDS